MLPSGWQPGNSSAIEAFRYVADQKVLQIAYIEGRKVYDFPCPPSWYQRFLHAPSRGRFVEWELKPYARGRGWAGLSYPTPW